MVNWNLWRGLQAQQHQQDALLHPAAKRTVVRIEDPAIQQQQAQQPDMEQRAREAMGQQE